MQAAKHGHLDVVTALLVTHHADGNKKMKDGSSVWDWYLDLGGKSD
jgi:hypothetical protein